MVGQIIYHGNSGQLKIHCIYRFSLTHQNLSFRILYNLPGVYAPTASYELLTKAVRSAEEKGLAYHVGNVLTSDTFYDDDPDENAKWRKLGVMCVEMETAALYMNAARAGKNALSVLTVSDSLITGEATDSDERQTGFNRMITLALDAAIMK